MLAEGAGYTNDPAGVITIEASHTKRLHLAKGTVYSDSDCMKKQEVICVS